MKVIHGAKVRRFKRLFLNKSWDGGCFLNFDDFQKEIDEFMKAERPPAKFGQISASEVQRVEELLRR